MAKPRARTPRLPSDADRDDAADAADEMKNMRGGHENDNESSGSGPEPEPQRDYAPAARPARKAGSFALYKRNQGKNTRMGTAVGAGIIIGGLAWFLYDQLEIYSNLYVQTGVAGVAALLLALLTYWLVGVNHRSCDFLIATDGELKKVSWSSKKEVIGSTKVVIATTLLMAILLFVVDILFLRVFQFIGVWEAT